MKKLIFLLLLIPIIGLAQEGGYRSLKTKSAKVTFTDLTGTGYRLLTVSPIGLSNTIQNGTNGQVLKIVNNTLSFADESGGTEAATIQTLSGTTVTWNLANGRDATITLTGNTVITLSNAITGLTGTLWVTNAASTYTITFAGYVNSIDPYIRLASNMVITSGGSKSDDYTFKYNGSKMNWNGTLDRH